MAFSQKTRGQTEAAITNAFTQFEREFLGRGPRDARTYIVGDMVLIRLEGILSPAEQRLGVEPGGVELIKQMRTRLIESSSNVLVQLVEEATGAAVQTMHTDISTRTGERIFVFGLDRDLDEGFRPV